MSGDEKHAQLKLKPRVNLVMYKMDSPNRDSPIAADISTPSLDLDSSSDTLPPPSNDSTPAPIDSTPSKKDSTPAPNVETPTLLVAESDDPPARAIANLRRVTSPEGTIDTSPVEAMDVSEIQNPPSPSQSNSRSETPIIKEPTPVEDSEDEVSFKAAETPGEGSVESRKRKRVSERIPRKPSRYSPDQELDESNSSVTSKASDVNTSKAETVPTTVAERVAKVAKRVMRQRPRVGQDDIVSKKKIFTSSQHASVEFGVPAEMIVDLEVMWVTSNADFIEGREERERLAALAAPVVVTKVEDLLGSDIEDEFEIKDEFDLEDEMLNVMSGKNVMSKIESIKSEERASSRESSVSRAESAPTPPTPGVKKVREVLAHLVKFGKSQADVKALTSQLKDMKREDWEEEVNVKIIEMDSEMKSKMKELASKLEQVDDDGVTHSEIKKLSEQVQAAFIKKVALDVTLLDDAVLSNLDLREAKGAYSKKDTGELKVKIEALETKNKQFSAEKIKMIKELKTLKSEKLDSEEELKDLKHDLQNKDKLQLTEEIDKLKKDKNTLRAHKKQLTEENQDLQSRLNKAEEARKLESNLKFSEPLQDLTTMSTNNDMQSLQIELEFYKEDNARLSSLKNKMAGDNDSEKLTKQVTDLKKENESISKDKASYKNRLNEMRKYRDKYDVLKKEKKDTDTKMEEYKAKISALEKETKTNSNLEKESELCDTLKADKESLIKEVATLKMQITENQNKAQEWVLQKEEDVNAQHNLELEKLKEAGTALEILLKEKIEKEEDFENQLKTSQQNNENRIEELKKFSEMESNHKSEKIEFEAKLKLAQDNLENELLKHKSLREENETLTFQVKLFKEKLGGSSDGPLDLEIHNKLNKMLDDIAKERKVVAEYKEKFLSADEERLKITEKFEIQKQALISLEDNVKNRDLISEENEKLKLELKTIQEENNMKVERAKEKESALICDFNQKVKAKDEIVVKYQEKIKSLEDTNTKLTTENEQKIQVIEKLDKKSEEHILVEKEKISLKSTIKELEEENESIKSEIRFTSAENEKSLKEQNKMRSELALKGNTIYCLERDKKDLEGNLKRQTQRYETEKRLESGEKDMLKTRLETKNRELAQKCKDYDSMMAEKVLPMDSKYKALQQTAAELQKQLQNSSVISTASSTIPAPKLKIRSFESLVQPSSAAPDILQNIMPSPLAAPLSTHSDLPFQAKRTGVVAPLPQTTETLNIPKAQVLPTNRGRDPRLQGVSDRDPRMQTNPERDPRQGSSRDPRYSNSAERDSSRYESSRYYSSSERDRESRHRRSPEREQRSSYDRQNSSSDRTADRQNSSYDRQNSSSGRERSRHSPDRPYSSSERRERDHRSQTSSERDRYHSDRDRGHRERSRHSPERDQRRRPPSPDRHQSERDPRRHLSSNRILSPAGGRSPSYSPSPLQSPVPSPVPPPAFGRPQPPLPSGPPPPLIDPRSPPPPSRDSRSPSPPSRDPRMAQTRPSTQPSVSAAASVSPSQAQEKQAQNMEKQLFDGLKEALLEAKQDQSVEDVEQKYDELLHNLLDSMPDEEEQILNALDRAFLVVFGRTARSRPNRGRQPPVNIYHGIPAAPTNVPPFQVVTQVQPYIIPQQGDHHRERDSDRDRQQSGRR